jgi:hypothetical protein
VGFGYEENTKSAHQDYCKSCDDRTEGHESEADWIVEVTDGHRCISHGFAEVFFLFLKKVCVCSFALIEREAAVFLG